MIITPDVDNGKKISIIEGSKVGEVVANNLILLNPILSLRGSKDINEKREKQMELI